MLNLIHQLSDAPGFQSGLLFSKDRRCLIPAAAFVRLSSQNTTTPFLASPVLGPISLNNIYLLQEHIWEKRYDDIVICWLTFSRISVRLGKITFPHFDWMYLTFTARLMLHLSADAPHMSPNHLRGIQRVEVKIISCSCHLSLCKCTRTKENVRTWISACSKLNAIK